MAQPALEEILVHEDGAAGSTKVISETHESRVVVVVVAEAEEHSDGAVSGHYIVQAQLYKTLCVILRHRDAGAFEQFEVWVETTGSQLFNVGVHQLGQVIIDSLEKKVSFVVVSPPAVPMAHSSDDDGIPQVLYGLGCQDGKLFIHLDLHLRPRCHSGPGFSLLLRVLPSEFIHQTLPLQLERFSGV